MSRRTPIYIPSEMRDQETHPYGPPAYDESTAAAASPDFPPPTYTPIPLHNESTVEVAHDVPLIPFNVGDYPILRPGNVMFTSQVWEEMNRQAVTIHRHLGELEDEVKLLREVKQNLEMRNLELTTEKLRLAKERDRLERELKTEHVSRMGLRIMMERLEERNRELELTTKKLELEWLRRFVQEMGRFRV